MSPSNRFRLCLVEDDPIMGESLCYRFELEGIAHDWYTSGEQALEALGKRAYSILVSDIHLPDMTGDELFNQLQRRNAPIPPTVFITGYGSIDHAVRLLKAGAADYITKPFDLDALIEKVRSLVPTLSDAAAEAPCGGHSLGISSVMRRVEGELCRFAAHNATVLITGESGVGKEHAARQLHLCADPEGRAPFVAINCAAVPESLLEAELFGHEKGAFTGAMRTKKGLFEQAHGGTLFLDEVGEMSPAMQAKVLRVIQERQIVRIGSEQLVSVELRLVCATNRDLQRMVEQGEFREDLYYRINVLHVHIPPLRERREDILWFARLFLDEIAARLPGLERRTLPPLTEQTLLGYGWPGNLRELHHKVERASILADRSALTPDLFGILGADTSEPACGGLREQLAQHERALILSALEACDYQIIETASHLGISRKNLWEKMRKLDIPH